MDFHFLCHVPLFRGCSYQQIQEIYQCFQGVCRTFSKGETIFHAGQKVSSLGIVLSGSATIESIDVWGNRTILDHIEAGNVFAETYACLPHQPMLVNAVAAQNCEILLLPVEKLLHPCKQNCGAHGVLIGNLLAISSQKNLHLSRRMFHTRSKLLRDRVISYLSFQSIQQNSLAFSIPFNRQQLADYLGVDRSALSNELSKMQKEGLITVQKNNFVLHPSLVEGNS